MQVFQAFLQYQFRMYEQPEKGFCSESQEKKHNCSHQKLKVKHRVEGATYFAHPSLAHSSGYHKLTATCKPKPDAGYHQIKYAHKTNSRKIKLA